MKILEIALLCVVFGVASYFIPTDIKYLWGFIAGTIVAYV